MLHGPTLFIAVILEAYLGALLLTWAWLQNRNVTALAWWSGAFFLAGTGMVLVFGRGELPDFVSIDLANALVISAYGLNLATARSIGGRRPTIRAVVAGAAIWLLLCQIPAFHASIDLRAAAASAIISAYMFLAAFEFWRGSDRLPSRRPVAALLFVHGILYAIRIGTSLASGADMAAPGVFSTFLLLETLVFSTATPFLLLAMAKESVELRHRTAAITDALTGVANRRGFFTDAEKLAGERSPVAIALLLFDLDRFKQINDTYGHPVGDRVLRLFSATASTRIGPRDLLGRIGGEEFAALVSGVNAEAARAVALDVIDTFADAARVIDGLPVGATASVGVAVAESPADLTDLLMRADRALYQAKTLGRNRAEDAAPAEVAPPNIASIAA